MISEITIEAEQTINYKIEHHQKFLKDYLLQQTEIPYNLEQFWEIRELAIDMLQK